MSELKTNLQSILQEKNTKIIPQNIKKDIEVLGVTGSYDKEDIKELQDELADAEQELVDVRRDLDNSTATVSGSGENVTLNGTAEARFKKAPLPLGNTEQEVIEAQVGTTVEGESINASGIDLSKVEILNINGNTKQETTTGKNKFNKKDIYTTNSAELDTGIKIFNAWTSIIMGHNIVKNLQPNTQYICNAKIKVTNKPSTMSSYNHNNILYLSNDSNSLIILSDSNKNNWVVGNIYEVETSFTTPENLDDYLLRGYTYHGNNDGSSTYIGIGEFEINELMIRLATETDTTYEPYTGGKASPNPDYPQEAYSAGANMNLFDKDTIDTNKYLDETGVEVGNSNWAISDYIPVVSGKIYSYSGITNSGQLPRSAYYDSSKNFISSFKTVTGKNSITIPSTVAYIRFSIYRRDSSSEERDTDTFKLEEGSKATTYSEYNQGNMNVEISNKNLFNLTADDFKNGDVLGNGKKVELTLKPNTNYTLSSNEPDGTSTETNIWFNGPSSSENGVGINRPKTVKTDASGKLYISIRTTKIDTVFENCWIQLEEGSTATTYVTHEEQSFTIPTQAPFRKIGDYKDTFVKKVDGKWYEKHIIGEVVFDGSEDENWQQDNNDTYITVSNAKGTGAIPVISNYFTYTGNASGNSWGQIRFGMSNNNLIFFGNLILSDFKAWLSTHNTIVNYVLKEPIYVECTQEQSNILDQINIFYETTNIFSIDEVSPNFTFTYNKVYASPSPDDESPIFNVTPINLLETSLAKMKSLNTTGTWNDNVYSNAGVTVTVKEDLSLEINGTSTSHQTFLLASNNTLDKGTYFLSQIISTEEKARIYVWDSDWESIVSTESLTKFTLNNNVSANIGVNIFNSKTFDHFIVKPMISKNIEKYTPCNYISVSVENKNLAWTGWAQDFVDRVNNSNRASLTTKDNRNCLAYVNSVSYQHYDTLYVFKANFKEKTAYTFSFDLFFDVGETLSTAFDIIYADGTTEGVFRMEQSANAWHKVTFSSNPNKTMLSFAARYIGTTKYIDLDTFMVLEGTYTAQTVPDYIPHQEQKFIFPLGNEKLMLGDYLADDGIHHVRTQDIFDGSEDEAWYIAQDAGFGTNYTQVSGYIAFAKNVSDSLKQPFDNTSKSVCNIAYPKTWYNLQATPQLGYCILNYTEQGVSNYARLWITMNRSMVNTLAEWKTWLQSNNVLIENELREEVIVPYTSAQQTVYNNIKKALSYDEQTTVSGTSSGASPRFDIVALRNMNDTLNTLENEIELLP